MESITTLICGFVKNVPTPSQERRKVSEMIPEEGTCDCEACVNYWEAAWKAYKEAHRAAWEAAWEALWEAEEAHKGDE